MSKINAIWEEAERQARSTGGFAGIDEAGRKRLIQDRYDQLIESDKQTKKFEGLE